MSYYYIESGHSAGECLMVLNDILDHNPRLLNNIWFGCESGDHTGRATLEARSEEEVRDLIPVNQRTKLQISKVEKYSPEQIHAMQEEKN
jgi:hypothetical protein